jgi:hypothetical protein
MSVPEILHSHEKGGYISPVALDENSLLTGLISLNHLQVSYTRKWLHNIFHQVVKNRIKMRQKLILVSRGLVMLV